MALSLITPVGSDFMKNWPSQNAVNSGRIDSFAGPCLTSHALQNYTPTLTASTTSPNLGSSPIVLGVYYRIFDQVFVWGEIRFGTGSSAGSGTYRVSLPLKAKTTISASAPFPTPVAVGVGQLFQNAADANRQACAVGLGAPEYLVFSVRMGTAGATRGVTNTVPFAWTTNDGIMWSARYKHDSS